MHPFRKGFEESLAFTTGNKFPPVASSQPYLEMEGTFSYRRNLKVKKSTWKALKSTNREYLGSQPPKIFSKIPPPFHFSNQKKYIGGKERRGGILENYWEIEGSGTPYLCTKLEPSSSMLMFHPPNYPHFQVWSQLL